MGRSTPKLWVCCAIGLAACVGPLAASATVLDIGPNGAVVTIERPSLHLSPNPGLAQPLEALTARRAAAGARGNHSQFKAPQPVGERNSVVTALRSAAQSQKLDPILLESVAARESGLRQAAVSHKGAMGVMQLMPSTASMLGVNPRDLNGNVKGGAIYFRALLDRYGGDLTKALVAYNAGPERASRYGAAPPIRETRAYVDAILERLAQAAVPRSSPAREPLR